MKRTILLICLLPAAIFCGNIAPNPNTIGYLKVNVVPSDAGLFVDGRYFGPASHHGMRKYLIAPGEHKVTMTDPRYEVSTIIVEVLAGKTVAISEALTPKPEPKSPFATLKVACGKEVLAAVMLNDEFVGTVSEFDGAGHGLEVAPGTYQVRIDIAGGESLLWQQVTLEAGKTTTVSWAL